MEGLILNVDSHLLPADSPWRTRDEWRDAPSPLFWLSDGHPVFEVWLWRLERWWCWTRQPAGYPGVVYFPDLPTLRIRFAELHLETRSVG